MAIIFFVQADRRFGYTSATEKENVNIIADGTGYYAYLPQYFIYPSSKNFSFLTFIDAKYPTKKFGSMFKKDENSAKRYNKFYVGTALLQSPFFLIAHGIQKIKGENADGYSITYRLWLNIGSIFFWLIAAVALLQLYARMGYSRITILIGIIFISFGTNLNYYISYYPSYSHIYSFAAISLFLNIAHSWSKKYSRKNLILLSLLLALIAIIRPVNVLVVLIIPFFFPTFKHFIVRLKDLFLSNKTDFIVAIFAFGAILFIQLLSNHNQTGNWSLYTYSGEGFTNALNPQFFNVLFSYEKGLFVYAPILLIAPLGIFFVSKKHGKLLLYGWLLTVSITLYVVSSWWAWTYGGGLGMRPLIEYFPLYILPILAIIENSHKIVSRSVMFFGIMTLFVYQTYQIQYNKNIISYANMNKTKFWQIFMKTDGRYGWMFDYQYDKLPMHHGVPIVKFEYSDGQWKTKENKQKVPFEISTNGNNIELKSTDSLPKFAQLSGYVAIHDGVNNPTLNTAYYSKKNLVQLREQPFGNKIDKVGVYKKIEIDVDLTKHKNCDQVLFELKHYGKHNSYKNLSLTIFN